MDSFIGCKIIGAKLSNLAEYKKEKYENPIINDVDKDIPGYIVYYPDISGNSDQLYISWSPKAIFEMAYRKITLEEKILVQKIDIELANSPKYDPNENTNGC